MQGYTFDQIRECMIELFCVPRSTLENPSYRVNNQGRSFTVLDYGELDGTTGYWAECEETGEEGFLAEFDDSFWIYDEEGCYWNNHPTPNRKLTKGRGKGKGKKGKTGQTKGGKEVKEEDS